ncbi:hypothetical protein LCGC14_2955710 [marine sediment metagenome]|uniref:Uncharacterized protein n=1 Tax=marine sediment metagenome TaxID=412755 RepID=A0A0F8XEI6_9ZZZZ
MLFLLLSMYMMQFTQTDCTNVQQLKLQIAIYKRQINVYPMTPFELSSLKKEIIKLKNDPVYVKYKRCIKPILSPSKNSPLDSSRD